MKITLQAFIDSVQEIINHSEEANPGSAEDIQDALEYFSNMHENELQEEMHVGFLTTELMHILKDRTTLNVEELNLNDVLKMVRELEDFTKEAIKVLKIFSDDLSWNLKYTDNNGAIEVFSHLDLDPRIISDHGLRAIQNAKDLSRELWRMLCDPIRSNEATQILLSNKDTKKSHD